MLELIASAMLIGALSFAAGIAFKEYAEEFADAEHIAKRISQWRVHAFERGDEVLKAIGGESEEEAATNEGSYKER